MVWTKVGKITSYLSRLRTLYIFFQDITLLRLSSILCAPGCVGSVIKCVIGRYPSQWIINLSPLPQDRRPLAPAAVAKMVVKRDDDSIVDVESVTKYLIEFLIVDTAT